MEMGFTRNRCLRAVIATDNNGAEVAMNWLFEHMDDPCMFFFFFFLKKNLFYKQYN